MSFRPTADQVRAIRPFKMGDVSLEAYIDLAETSSYAITTSSKIPTDAARTTLWALLAAHFATVMAEPEPEQAQIGNMKVDWKSNSIPPNRSGSSLVGSAPGKEFARRWRRYNIGRVLR